MNLTTETIDRAVVSVRQHRASPVAPLSRHLPPFDAAALSLARTIEEIDAITDKLVADGLARDRADTSMLDALQAQAARRYGGRK